MAISETVYSPDYPNNSKTVTIDIVQRVPTGAAGDEKFILYIYTTAYSNNTARTAIDPVFMYNMRRGWCEGFSMGASVTLAGTGLMVALDEDGDGVQISTATGSYPGSTIASQIQDALRYTAISGVRAASSNRLSYLNCQCLFQDGRFRIVSGSVKDSYNNTLNWNKTSSAKVKLGYGDAAVLGFTAGYPNSFDISTTASGILHAPGSALVTVDDAIRFGIETLINQIDFTS